MQATCTYHKLSVKTGCKKRVNLRSRDEEEIGRVQRALLSWCNCATSVTRQSHHMAINPPVACPPAHAVLWAQRITTPPPDVVPTDAELDELGVP